MKKPRPTKLLPVTGFMQLSRKAKNDWCERHQALKEECRDLFDLFLANVEREHGCHGTAEHGPQLYRRRD